MIFFRVVFTVLSSNFLARKFTFIHLLEVWWSMCIRCLPVKLHVKMKSKNCQYCGEHLNANAHFCTHCNHTQKSKPFLVTQFCNLQILRYAPIGMFVALPTITLLYFTNFVGYTLELAAKLTEASFTLGVIWFMLLVILPSLPESTFKDVSVPALLNKIEFLQKSVWRNWVIFPFLTITLLYVMVHLANTKPSKEEFSGFVQKAYSKGSRITPVYGCALFDLYWIESETGLDCIVSANERFTPFGYKDLLTSPN